MEDLKSKLFQATRTVSQMTGDLMKNAKTSMALSGEEDKLKNIYIEIGKKVHEIYMFGGTLGKFFDEKYAEIEDCERKIAELKKQIDTIKGTQTCPKCGKPVAAKAEFCSKCGTKMEGKPAESKPVTEEDIMRTLEKIRAEESATDVPSASAPAEIPVPPPEVTEPAKNMRKCTLCGAENETGEKYCYSCGRML